MSLVKKLTVGYFGGRGLAPPAPKEVKGNLDGHTGIPADRRTLPRTNRTEQFNVRVSPDFREFVEDEAKAEGVTKGYVMDRMLAAYKNQKARKEAGGALLPATAPEFPPHVLAALKDLARSSRMSEAAALETLIADKLEAMGRATSDKSKAVKRSR